jgi:hypothetical protein
VAIGDAGLAAQVDRKVSTTKRLKSFLSRYFYLCMSLVMAVLVVWGFSQTVGDNLLHANPPRPLLLWIHAAVFSAWVVFFILQSTLVRARKVSVHRLLGWFGAGLASVMVPLGFTIAVLMARFKTTVLHDADAAAFLSIPFPGIIFFGACMAMAIYWRTRPEYHRRLVFIASCALMGAALDRFDFIFYHNLGYASVDLLVVLGMARDWFVDGRAHKVYLYALPVMIIVETFAMYLWKVNPAWWQGMSHAIVG